MLITVLAMFNQKGICGGADEVLDYTIQVGEIVDCYATNSIRLAPGFHAEEGSTFRGYIKE